MLVQGDLVPHRLGQVCWRGYCPLLRSCLSGRPVYNLVWGASGTWCSPLSWPHFLGSLELRQLRVQSQRALRPSCSGEEWGTSKPPPSAPPLLWRELEAAGLS